MKLLRFLLSILIASLFFGVFYLLYTVLDGNELSLPRLLSFLEPRVFIIVSMGIMSLILGLICYFVFSNQIVLKISKQEKVLEKTLINMKFNELLASVAGCVVGLIIANLIGVSILKIPFFGIIIVTMLNVLLGLLGIRVAKVRKDDFKSLFNKSNAGEHKSSVYGRPKVLDTSVIIDGRILDILKTGFIEGKIIIPDFVLEELRHIADSSDSLKRNRGRRGLDILNEIQNQVQVPVEIITWDIKDTDEVDNKLLKVGKKLDAFVVTNDFNLNKVAEFQKVSVLNINDLSGAVKTVVLPGENMEVVIVKDGKENKQGIGYLEDGTMIVVENALKHIGKTVSITVTSVLQTSAGRMIFAKMN